MTLDVLTLLLVLGTGCVLIGVALLVIWHQKRSERALLWWSLSLFLRAPAFALILLRGRVPDWLSIDLAFVFLFLGTGLSWAAARLQSRQPIHTAVTLAPVGAWLLACQIPEIHDTMANRLLVISLILAVYACAIGFEFLRQARTFGRLRGALAAVFLTSAVAHLSRAGYSAFQPLPEVLPQVGPVIAASLYIYLLIIFVGGMLGIGFYWEQVVRALQYEADNDALTGVLNRRAFDSHATRLLDRQRGGTALAAVLLFDLDHFKTVNDRFGHQAGDAALRGVCDLIQGHLRNADLFARIGGEEFVALLPAITPADACRVAESLRSGVESLAVAHGDTINSVTVSIGVACVEETNIRLADLMAAADAALYEAKLGGRNQIVCSEPSRGGAAIEPAGRPSRAGLSITEVG